MEQDFRWGGINVRYLLQYLLKYLWIGVALGFVLCLVGNRMAANSVTISYSTNAVFYVIQSNTAPLPNNISTRNVLAGNANSVITSEAFLWDVKNITGITNVDVYTEIIENTNLLSVTCTSDDPKSSYEFMRGIINNFKYITRYISGDLSIKIYETPKIPTGGNVTVRSTPSPILLGAGGIFLISFILIAVYLLRITYKGTGEIFKQFGEDVLLIIPYTKAWDPKKPRISLPGKKEPRDDAAVCEIRKLSFLIRQEIQKNKKKVFFFTSAGNSEGKHTICKKVVRDLVNYGFNVVYIDGSLIDVLSHESISRDNLIPDPELGCDTIQAAQSGKSYTSESVSSLLTEIRAEKDVFIICGESGEDEAMLSIWSALSDAAYLIIRENKEDIRKIDALYKKLKDTSQSFEGCILNAFM